MTYRVTFLGRMIARQHVLDALKEFDVAYPDAEWLDDDKYKYAILYEDKLYPCKRILSLASGFDVSEFSGGDQTNNVLRRLGFEVIDKP